MTALRVAPTGVIASGDAKGVTRVWEFLHGNETKEKKNFELLSDKINDIAFTEDAKRIVVVGYGK